MVFAFLIFLTVVSLAQSYDTLIAKKKEGEFTMEEMNARIEPWLMLQGIALSAKEKEFTVEEKIAGIIEMKKTVNMLRMKNEGKHVPNEDYPKEHTIIRDNYPSTTSSMIRSSTHIYDGGETLSVYYNRNELNHAINKDGFDLLLTEYAAKAVDVPVFINGKEVITSSPIMIIKNKHYIPIVDFADQLGIKVSWDESQEEELRIAEKNAVPMMEAAMRLSKGMTRDETEELLGAATDYISGRIPVYSFKNSEILRLFFDKSDTLSGVLSKKDGLDLLSAEYIARAINFPIFINDSELLISNPIVFINNQVYVPVENFAEQLGIKVNFNEESQQLEITTK